MAELGERQPTHETLVSELLVLAGTMAGVSEGRIRVAVHEADENTSHVPDAAHFLKLDEVRIGRDIELYGFMGRISGDADALGDFVGGVLLPLKGAIPEVYEVAAPLVERLGYRLIDSTYHEAWRAIFQP